MRWEVRQGAVAGAAGTLALNAMTYLDVAARGRPPSSLPQQTVAKIADQVGVSLAREGPQSARAEHRRTGLAALSGYATGVAVGIAYALVRPRVRGAPVAVAGLLAGAAAMAMTDISAARLGVTDPRTWGVQDWLEDLVPHAIYGLALAATFDRVRHGEDRRRVSTG